MIPSSFELKSLVAVVLDVCVCVCGERVFSECITVLVKCLNTPELVLSYSEQFTVRQKQTYSFKTRTTNLNKKR